MSGWIATLGVPPGHRVRFLYRGGLEHGSADRTLECECGRYRVTYAGDDARRHALTAHARHAHMSNLLRSERGELERTELMTIGARDALTLLEHAADDDARRLDDAPHPAELDEL